MSAMLEEQLGLFDVADVAPKPAPRPRRGDSGIVHVLQPNMGFACGRIMLDEECLADRWVMGVYRGSDWQAVTCPDCRAVGRRELHVQAHLMQKPVGHTCDDTCPDPDQNDDSR